MKRAVVIPYPHLVREIYPHFWRENALWQGIAGVSKGQLTGCGDLPGEGKEKI